MIYQVAIVKYVYPGCKRVIGSFFPHVYNITALSVVFTVVLLPPRGTVNNDRVLLSRPSTATFLDHYLSYCVIMSVASGGVCVCPCIFSVLHLTTFIVSHLASLLGPVAASASLYNRKQ